MTDDELRELLRGPESERVEFKESLNRERLKRTAVAFANRLYEPEPGVLFIGVKDDGTIVGVANPDDVQRDVRRHVEECFPRIPRWEARPIDVQGKTVIALIVYESTVSPHFTGEAFVRRGSESVAATMEMHERLLVNHRSDARRLGPFVGQEIQFQEEVVSPHVIRVWNESVRKGTLLSVDAIGIVIDIGAGAYVRADWSRVKVQPFVKGRPPYVRVRLD